MARPRKQTEPLEPETTQGQPSPELHTPESLGYAPGEPIPLHHLNLIGTPIQ